MKYANSNVNYKKMMAIKKAIVGDIKESFSNPSDLKKVPVKVES